ncbi:MAG: aldehyde dehydrogenase family protein [bacterium JZ-2024 1]
MFIEGKRVKTEEVLYVKNPVDEEIIGEVSVATEKEVEWALEAAVKGKEEMRRLPPGKRYEILQKASEVLRRDREEWAKRIVMESGKTIREARLEVERASYTLLWSAEEAKRLAGEMVPMDAVPRGEGKLAFTLRVPVGVVLAISPFNFPLNLACHKVGPALAGGNAVILKPSSYTPLTGIALGELLLECGLPERGISVLIGPGDTVGDMLVRDSRVNLISLTGSVETGERVCRNAGMKRVLLELGSNSSVILDEGDLPEGAWKKIVVGAFAQAGQVCISVQKLYLPSAHKQNVVERLLTLIGNLKVGDPMEEDTDVGPMIDSSAVKRVLSWVEEARQSGAQILPGITQEGNFLHPFLIVDAPENISVCAQEAFAPLLVVQPVSSFDEAVQRVNQSVYGLQCGVFTRNLEHIWKAIKEIECGGVLINEVPTFRVDHMPYGGVKKSGIGREGPRYALEEMTEMKLISLNML